MAHSTLGRRQFLRTSTALGLSWAAVARAGDDESAPTIDVGDEPQLLLDDFLIAAAAGLERRVHQPRKMGLIQEADGQPWDRGSVYHGNIVCRDRSGRFHMTYRYFWWDPEVEKLIGEDKAHWFRETVGYATSDDGIRWQKPRLGLVEAPTGYERRTSFPFEVPAGTSKENSLGCPFDFIYDLNAHGNIRDPQRRFLLRLARYDDTQPFAKLVESQMCYAADWPDFAGDPQWREKLIPLEGATLSPRGFKNISGYDPTAGEWFVVGQDIIGNWLKRGGRDLARYSSPDLVSWQGPDHVLGVAADESRVTSDWVEYMDMNAYRVGGERTGAWLGEIVIFHSDRGNPQFEMPTIANVWRKGTTELRLTISRDAGRTWQRVGDKQLWLPCHTDDDGFDRLVFGTYPVEVGDEWWFYYGCWDGDHLVFNRDGSTYYPHRTRQARTARAVLRRNGLVSLRAGDGFGELTTHRLTTAASRLAVNAAAAAGEIRVELLDGQGQPLEGYRFDDCQPLTGDGVAQLVRWRGQERLPDSLAQRPLRLRWRVRNADLFAFQFTS